MPVISLTKYQKLDRQNMKFNKWIRGKLASERISLTEMAKVLGISPQALSKRLLSNSPFNYIQMIQIFELIQPEDEEILKFMKIGG